MSVGEFAKLEGTLLETIKEITAKHRRRPWRHAIVARRQHGLSALASGLMDVVCSFAAPPLYRNIPPRLLVASHNSPPRHAFGGLLFFRRDVEFPGLKVLKDHVNGALNCPKVFPHYRQGILAKQRAPGRVGQKFGHDFFQLGCITYLNGARAVQEIAHDFEEVLHIWAKD